MFKTRFAPSPTGYLHIGGARTALCCWLEARRQGGQFVLRIEDTDRERSTPEATEAILEGLRWLGLDWDEGPFFQSQRGDRYSAAVDQLLESGHAYKCYCSRERLAALREEQKSKGIKPKYDGLCRDQAAPEKDDIEPVVRFRNPEQGEVVFNDRIRGQITISNTEIDDLIIARPDGSPTYNLTVVVDDLDMGITLVIRGEDHINNTPRQINIYRALGKEPPEFAHVSMIHGDDGAKLSKRHGAVSVLQYREDGFLPQAVLNYLVRLGWSHGDQEVFSVAEMIEFFDIAEVSKSASSFNTEKLLWLNQQYIAKTPPAEIVPHLEYLLLAAGMDWNGYDLEQVVAVFAGRPKTLLEMIEQAKFLFQEITQYDEKVAAKHLQETNGRVLQALEDRFMAMSDWQTEAIKATFEDVMADFSVGMGKVGQPLRVAITGNGISPDIAETLVLLGRERTLVRLKNAIDYINVRSSQTPV